jgi:phytoene desaturase
MSHIDFEQGVYYPLGGMYTIVQALSEIGKQLGVQYRFNAPVQKIITERSKASGVLVNDTLEPADYVISGADLHFTETQLLSPADQTYPEPYWQNKIAAPTGLLMYLGVRGSLPQLEHHNLLFVEPWQQNFDAIFTNKHWPERASLYVSRTSATDETVAPKGHENIFMFVPLPAGIPEPVDLEAAADSYLAQFAEASNIPDFKKRIVYRSVRSMQYFADDFHAWSGSALGMAHTLRQSAFWRPSAKSKKVKNLFYVGAGVQPGIGLPMCLISAELLIKHMQGDTSTGPLTQLGKYHG